MGKRPTLCMLLFIMILAVSAGGQTTVQGVVRDARTNIALPNTAVSFMLSSSLTDERGRFLFEAEQLEQEVVLIFEKSGYQTKYIHFQLSGQQEIDIGIIPLTPQEGLEQLNGEDFLPVLLPETDALSGTGRENLSGLLTASSDIFVSRAAYHFGAARFRLRGYESRNTQVLLNGLTINDPSHGYTSWSTWAGMNDVLRNRINVVGLEAAPFAFGGVGGATLIDTRASRHPREVRASYAFSNRLYNNRIMGTVSSGALPKGWAVTLSGSRRWSEEGFFPGTYYDAWSYFLSVSKLLGSRHELNLTVLGAPLTQGMASPATSELYDLAGSPYYNPNWGYQLDRKRNARNLNQHQPLAIFRHDWQLGTNSTLTTSLGYQLGRSGTTALEWYDARDPRPDYYRRLPSFIDNEQAPQIEEALRNDEALRQIDWAYLYDVNRNNIQTIRNVEGIAGNDVTGRRAQYLLEERRDDSHRLLFNTNLHARVSNTFQFSGGLDFQLYRGRRFKLVDDLLDADYFLDIDKFAEFYFPGDESIIHNDISRPNRIVMEGDTFGYHYQTQLNRGGAWLQFDFTFGKVDFFLAGNASYSWFWRDGAWANGRFPDDSQGPSEQQEFLNYGGKAGLAYKFNGRNFLIVNGTYLTRAPFLEDAFVSARTRNQWVDNLESEEIYGGELSYLYRGPRFVGRLTGYYTLFNNHLSNFSLYRDNAVVAGEPLQSGGYANYILQGVHVEHRGLEAALEWTLAPGLRLSTVAALGEYTYTERPEVTVMLDHEAAPEREYTAFLQNFYVPNTPQTALSAGIHYNAPKFWFVNLSVNYFDDIWIDFNPDRRSEAAVTYPNDPDNDVVEPDSELWNQIIFQEKAPSALTLDFFGGVSWRMGKTLLYLNAGVNNILDNQSFVIGGSEQFHFDFENKNVDLFPNRYSYGLGRNFFVQVALKL